MGGAIFNLGDLTVSNTRFFTNSAVGGNGGDGGAGGSGGAQAEMEAARAVERSIGGAIYDGGANYSITDLHARWERRIGREWGPGRRWRWRAVYRLAGRRRCGRCGLRRGDYQHRLLHN